MGLAFLIIAIIVIVASVLMSQKTSFVIYGNWWDAIISSLGSTMLFIGGDPAFIVIGIVGSLALIIFSIWNNRNAGNIITKIFYAIGSIIAKFFCGWVVAIMIIIWLGSKAVVFTGKGGDSSFSERIIGWFIKN